MSRYDYVKYDDHSIALSADYKKRFEELEAALNLDLSSNTASIARTGRSLSVAMTKLEEAFMWVGKAIRDKQFDREVTTAVADTTREVSSNPNSK
jgi:hypothetical protein